MGPHGRQLGSTKEPRKAATSVTTTFSRCKTVCADIQEDKQTYQDTSLTKQGICYWSPVQKGSKRGGSRNRLQKRNLEVILGDVREAKAHLELMCLRDIKSNKSFYWNFGSKNFGNKNFGNKNFGTKKKIEPIAERVRWFSDSRHKWSCDQSTNPYTGRNLRGHEYRQCAREDQGRM